MRAIISGQADLAFVDTDGNSFLVSSDSPEVHLPCTRDCALRLFGDAADLTAVETGAFESVMGQLESAWRVNRSLHMVLILLNPEEGEENRSLAAECLEEFLVQDSVAEYLRNRLFSAPLPERCDLDRALQIASAFNRRLTPDFIRHLSGRQPNIARVRSAWECVSEVNLGGVDGKQYVCEQLIRFGGFRVLVDAQADTQRFGAACLQLLELLPQIERPGGVDQRHWNPRAAMRDWTGALWPSQVEGAGDRLIADDWNDVERLRPRDPEGRGREALDVVKEKIERQKMSILKRLRVGDLSLAQQYVDDLIKFQEKNSDPRHIAMSLCDVAARALRNRNAQFCLNLADRAVDIAPGDPVPYSLRAMIFGTTGRLSDALAAYEDTIARFPDEVVPRNGRADTLKAMSRFDDALAAYEDTIARFPDEVVPRAGRADTLKAMGRLAEALTAYEETIAMFPGDAVPGSGRAEVLRAMGRFDDAMAAYEDTIAGFPDDVVPRNGRAEALKVMGRFDDALAAYQDTIARFSDDVVSRNGRAETLKAMGRFDDALAAYEENISRFPDEAVPRNGRADTLKAIGRFDDALAAYEDTITRFPDDVVPRNGRAGTLKAMGRFDESLTEFEALLIRNSLDRFASAGVLSCLVLLERHDEVDARGPVGAPQNIDDWVEWHILGMSLLRRRQVDRALEIFSRGAAECPWIDSRVYFQSALSFTRLRQRRWADACEAVSGVTKPIAFALRLHAHGELSELQSARDDYKHLQDMARTTLTGQLRDQLASRYRVVAETLAHPWSEDEIFEAEYRMLLVAA